MQNMKKRKKYNNKILSTETEIKIRFSEVDAMSIVWHGSYVKYLEDGRENFGEKYGLGYMDIYSKGYLTPIVKLNINYKKTIIYGDIIIVKTTFIDNIAAKINFEYEKIKKYENKIITTAESTQVFLNKKRKLELFNPEFFILWKNKYL